MHFFFLALSLSPSSTRPSTVTVFFYSISFISFLEESQKSVDALWLSFSQKDRWPFFTLRLASVRRSQEWTRRAGQTIPSFLLSFAAGLVDRGVSRTRAKNWHCVTPAAFYYASLVHWIDTIWTHTFLRFNSVSLLCLKGFFLLSLSHFLFSSIL